MLSYTIQLNYRTHRPLHLSDEEAMELYEQGFRFSIFRPGREACQLSMPFETIIDLQRETLTIRQPEGRG
jgi:hypothetical protein